MRRPTNLPQPNEKQREEIKKLNDLAFAGFSEEYDAAVDVFNKENRGHERAKYADLPGFMKNK